MTMFQSTPGPEGPGDQVCGTATLYVDRFQSTPGPEGPGDLPLDVCYSWQ